VNQTFGRSLEPVRPALTSMQAQLPRFWRQLSLALDRARFVPRPMPHTRASLIPVPPQPLPFCGRGSFCCAVATADEATEQFAGLTLVETGLSALHGQKVCAT